MDVVAVDGRCGIFVNDENTPFVDVARKPVSTFLVPTVAYPERVHVARLGQLRF